MNQFELHSNYEPSGDQPRAIKELTDGKSAVINFRLCLVLPEVERLLLFLM